MSIHHPGSASAQARRVVDAIEHDGLEPDLVRLKVYETAYGLGVALSADEVLWAMAEVERKMATRA
jgi:hypothetical protein